MPGVLLANIPIKAGGAVGDHAICGFGKSGLPLPSTTWPCRELLMVEADTTNKIKAIRLKRYHRAMMETPVVQSYDRKGKTENCLLPPHHQHLGADAAHHEVIGEGGGQFGQRPKAGAVAGDDEFRVDFLEALDGILDEVLAPGGEMKAADDERDFIHAGEFLGVFHHVDDARMAAAADDHQAPALNHGHQGLLVAKGVRFFLFVDLALEHRRPFS